MKLEEMKIYKNWLAQFGTTKKELVESFSKLSKTECLIRKNSSIYMDGTTNNSFSQLTTVGAQMGVFADILKEFLSEEDKFILTYDDLEFSKEPKVALVKIDEMILEMKYYLDDLGYEKIEFHGKLSHEKINLMDDDVPNDSSFHKNFFNALRVELL